MQTRSLAERSGFDFALRSANPVRAGALTVRFSLSDPSPAALEVFDIAGRRVAGREVGSLGVGPHAIDLSDGWRAVPGVYFLWLTQGQNASVRRVVLLR